MDNNSTTATVENTNNVRTPSPPALEQDDTGNQVDNHFRTNRPEHSRTEKGHLIFNCNFDPNKPRKITDLSTLELDAVIASFNLPKPSILINKKSLIKHVQKHFLKKYPRATLEDGSVVFGRPDEPKPTKP